MRAIILAAAAATGIGLMFSPAALAAPDRTVKVDGAAPVAKWEGAPATGVNQTFTLQEVLGLGQCGKLAINYCEDTVVNAGTPASAGAKLKLTIDGFAALLPPPVPSLFDDFDLFVYKSDASGKVGDFVVTGGEGAGTPEVVTVDNASGFYLVRVVYYATLEAGYMGTAELLGAPKPATVLTPGTPPTGGPGSPPQPQPQPAPAPGQTPPATGKPQTLPAKGKLTISFAADKGKRKTARKRGMRVRVRCSVQCKATAVVKISKKVARQLKLGKKAMKIGKGRATIVKPGRIPFFIKLNKKAKRALGRKRVKKFKLKVAIRVTDTSGGQLKKGTKKVTLR